MPPVVHVQKQSKGGIMREARLFGLKHAPLSFSET